MTLKSFWRRKWERLTPMLVGENRSIDLWFNHQRPDIQLQDSNAVFKKTPSYHGHSFQFMFPVSVNRVNCSAGQVRRYYSLIKQIISVWRAIFRRIFLSFQCSKLSVVSTFLWLLLLYPYPLIFLALTKYLNKTLTKFTLQS